jgi:hypothetical protein
MSCGEKMLVTMLIMEPILLFLLCGTGPADLYFLTLGSSFKLQRMLLLVVVLLW